MVVDPPEFALVWLQTFTCTATSSFLIRTERVKEEEEGFYKFCQPTQPIACANHVQIIM